MPVKKLFFSDTKIMFAACQADSRAVIAILSVCLSWSIIFHLLLLLLPTAFLPRVLKCSKLAKRQSFDFLAQQTKGHCCRGQDLAGWLTSQIIRGKWSKWSWFVWQKSKAIEKKKYIVLLPYECCSVSGKKKKKEASERRFKRNKIDTSPLLEKEKHSYYVSRLFFFGRRRLRKKNGSTKVIVRLRHHFMLQGKTFHFNLNENAGISNVI